MLCSSLSQASSASEESISGDNRTPSSRAGAPQLPVPANMSPSAAFSDVDALPILSSLTSTIANALTSALGTPSASVSDVLSSTEPPASPVEATATETRAADSAAVLPDRNRKARARPVAVQNAGQRPQAARRKPVVVVAHQAESTSLQGDLGVLDAKVSEDSSGNTSNVAARNRSIQMLPWPEVGDLLPKRRMRAVHVVDAAEVQNLEQSTQGQPPLANSAAPQIVKSISGGMLKAVTGWICRARDQNSSTDKGLQAASRLPQNPLQGSGSHDRSPAHAWDDIAGDEGLAASGDSESRRSSRGLRLAITVQPASSFGSNDSSSGRVSRGGQNPRRDRARNIVVQQAADEAETDSILDAASGMLKGLSGSFNSSGGRTPRRSRAKNIVVQQAGYEPTSDSSQGNRAVGRSQSRQQSKPRRRDIIVQQHAEGDADFARVADNINTLFVRSSSSSHTASKARRSRARAIEVQAADSDEDADDATSPGRILRDASVQSGRAALGNVIQQRRNDDAELAMNTNSFAAAELPESGPAVGVNADLVGQAGGSALSGGQGATSPKAPSAQPLQPASLEERWRRERLRASRTTRGLGVDGAPNLQMLEGDHTRRFDDDVWGGDDAWEDL